MSFFQTTLVSFAAKGGKFGRTGTNAKKGLVIYMHEYTAIVSSSANDAADALSRGFDILRLPCDHLLAPPVASHPDMIVSLVGNRLFMHEEYYENNRGLFDGLDVLTVPGVGARGKNYPLDVGYNVLFCGGYAFALSDHTAPEIKEYLEEVNIPLVNVKQGYAACSTLALENSLITADGSVADSAERCGIQVTRIINGGITLPGYDTGFIGGASGVMGRTVYFSGNIDSHPDAEKIRRHLDADGYSIISLTDGELTDIGGIKFVKNQTSLTMNSALPSTDTAPLPAGTKT